ncbi:MAG: sigma-70 family RNA polymerase sigma factor [Isosphaeraceae bacterium]
MKTATAAQHGGDAGGLPGSLRRLFAAGALGGLTDGQLLDRFLRGRRDADANSSAGAAADAEAAFAAIVERHGAMVWQVCRSVLGDRHDAEDACQAAFLVLARRAGAIRQGESVASWLYGVARRVALRARRDASRRRELERRRLERLASNEPTSPPTADPWPELYEELDRLPEPFRAAVVSCDLEGLTYEQAAVLLGCPVGTVQSRLARGRSRLRNRLERRGIAPAIIGVVLGATGPAVRAASSLPSALSESITRAACGIGAGRTIAASAPAAVASLAGAEVRRQVMRRIVTLAMTFLMTGVTATTALVLASAGRDGDPRPQGQQQQPPAVAKAAPARLHVRVVEIDGKPAPGVVMTADLLDRPAQSYTTDTDGRAVIPADTIDEFGVLVARRGRDVLAWASIGLQPDRHAGTEDAPIVMKLLPLDHRVEGSVVDRQGRPVEGAVMTADLLDHPTNGLFSELNAMEPLIDSVPTDRQGRFAMRLPREVKVLLRAVHPRLASNGRWVEPDHDRLAPVDLRPAGSIAGRVVEAGTGRPVPGAIVGAQYIERIERIIGAWGDARADAQGRFLIGGLEPGVYNLLGAVPGRPELTARAVEGVRVRLDASTPAELSVMTGRPLRVIVVDRDTGQPRAGVEVGCYGPAHPRSGAAVDMRKTDEHGRHTFRVPPGEQWVYVADGTFNNRLGSRTTVVPEQGELEPIRLLLRRPSALMGSMAVTKVEAPPPVKAAIPPPLAKADVQEVNAVPVPAPPPAPDGDGQPAPKAADPNARTLTGLVRDPTGRPLPGVEVRISATETVVATDRDGVFELTHVPAGAVRIDLQRYGGKFQSETIPAGRDRVELTLAPDTYTSPDEHVTVVDEPIPADLRDRLTFVDLQRDGNDFLADGPASGGNDLNRLPRGVHKLGATYFRIGEKMVHLGGRERPDLPESVKGIKVGARGRVLHFLHSTQGGLNMDDRLIGAYVIHYADGSIETIPFAYARDITNWWHREPGRRLTRGKVAWTGLNDAVAQHVRPGLRIRLFEMTWTNPHPEKEIATLDVLSKGKECDPFLVALTLERAR